MTTQTPQSFSTSGTGGDPTVTGSGGGASVRERAGLVGGSARDEAAGVAQEVKYQARDLAGEARTQVRQQVDTQKNRLSDLLRDISNEFEQMADRSDNNGIASDLARQAAARARDARGYLDGGGDMLSDVRSFARRRPGTFLLGALAAGLLAGRATRAATAARREEQPQSGQAYSPYAGGPTGYSGGPGYSGETSYGTAGYATPGSAAASGYSTGTIPSTAPPSGYASAPAESTGYGTTAAGASYQTTGETAEYYEEGTATYDPATGYTTGRPAGAQAGYVTPAETLPPEREDRS